MRTALSTSVATILDPAAIDLGAAVPTGLATHSRQAAYVLHTLKDINHLSRSVVGALEWGFGTLDPMELWST